MSEEYECEFCGQETDEDYNLCEWCPLVACQCCSNDGEFCPACGEATDDDDW